MGKRKSTEAEAPPHDTTAEDVDQKTNTKKPRRRSRGSKSKEVKTLAELTKQQRHQLLAWHAGGKKQLRPDQLELAKQIKEEYLAMKRAKVGAMAQESANEGAEEEEEEEE
eukprot:CAMPEP_0198198242 /NCGR_PEP_ID=MMETSP1445-20131203/1733_1 /TAXON_ID=36898 /ORGANISM="Pyramimonas sp., Strain CCMP2087" /LENGTH=110 /DNA_ID=CAMNT_0043867745 /DNA_START=307 /DNA_END=636 /DNA_ORIENTATION=+